MASMPLLQASNRGMSAEPFVTIGLNPVGRGVERADSCSRYGTLPLSVAVYHACAKQTFIRILGWVGVGWCFVDPWPGLGPVWWGAVTGRCP